MSIKMCIRDRDYLDYLYSGKDFNADDFNPDRKNEIGKVPIRNKKVALTGLSLGGIIMLPVRKERNSKKSRQDEIARKNLIPVSYTHLDVYKRQCKSNY